MKNSDPKPGWHYRYCATCGDQNGRVTHYAGKTHIAVCSYCLLIPSYCSTCWLNSNYSKVSKMANKVKWSLRLPKQK